MTTVIESTPTDTQHRIETDTDRTKFLRRVLREDGWNLNAKASDDWQITFRRTIKGKPGDPDVDVTVRIKDKISLVGKWGKQQSFSDSKEVIVPKPDRAWLSYGSVQTAAKFILDGSHLIICGSSGSTSSSEYGLAFVSLKAEMKRDTVEIGHQSVYLHGKMVCCGSVE
jgi:hypothetical protein